MGGLFLESPQPKAEGVLIRLHFLVQEGQIRADAIVRHTRSFARRQRMWFRRDPRITWYGARANPCELLPALLAAWSP